MGVSKRIRFLAFATLIGSLIARKLRTTRESTHNAASSSSDYIDDSIITGRIKAALLSEASLTAADINVTTSKGIVELSGTVHSELDKQTAANIAYGIKGVVTVHNHLRLIHT